MSYDTGDQRNMVNSCFKIENKLGKCFFVYQANDATIAKKQAKTKQQKHNFKISFSYRYFIGYNFTFIKFNNHTTYGSGVYIGLEL